MKKQEAIEQAKKLAESDYNTRMINIGCYNAKCKRSWYKKDFPNGRAVWALEGTPDKAFVAVTESEVIAMRQDQKVLQKFTIGE